MLYNTHPRHVLNAPQSASLHSAAINGWVALRGRQGQREGRLGRPAMAAARKELWQEAVLQRRRGAASPTTTPWSERSTRRCIPGPVTAVRLASQWSDPCEATPQRSSTAHVLRHLCAISKGYTSRCASPAPLLLLQLPGVCQRNPGPPASAPFLGGESVTRKRHAVRRWWRPGWRLC